MFCSTDKNGAGEHEAENPERGRKRSVRIGLA